MTDRRVRGVRDCSRLRGNRTDCPREIDTLPHRAERILERFKPTLRAPQAHRPFLLLPLLLLGLVLHFLGWLLVVLSGRVPELRPAANARQGPD